MWRAYTLQGRVCTRRRHSGSACRVPVSRRRAGSTACVDIPPDVRHREIDLVDNVLHRRQHQISQAILGSHTRVRAAREGRAAASKTWMDGDEPSRQDLGHDVRLERNQPLAAVHRRRGLRRPPPVPRSPRRTLQRPGVEEVKPRHRAREGRRDEAPGPSPSDRQSRRGESCLLSSMAASGRQCRLPDAGRKTYVAAERRSSTRAGVGRRSFRDSSQDLDLPRCGMAGVASDDEAQSTTGRERSRQAMTKQASEPASDQRLHPAISSYCAPSLASCHRWGVQMRHAG